MRRHLILVLILLAVGIAVFSFPQLPDRIPVHWNFHGEVDGYGSKTFGAFWGPGLAILIYLGFTLLPKIDPLAKNYRRFKDTYLFLRDVLIAFFLALWVVPVIAGLGYPINMNTALPAIMSLLMIVFGNYLGKVKRNWFLGIRTPWTLDSEEVWNKTHRLGGRAFLAAGLVSLGASFTPYGFQVMISLVLAVAVLTVVYSAVIGRPGASG